MDAILSIAQSSLTAACLRLQSVASNLGSLDDQDANPIAPAASPSIYRWTRAVLGSLGGGLRPQVQTVEPALIQTYAPGSACHGPRRALAVLDLDMDASVVDTLWTADQIRISVSTLNIDDEMGHVTMSLIA